MRLPAFGISEEVKNKLFYIDNRKFLRNEKEEGDQLLC